MKKIPKKLLDDCIKASRAYWASGNKSVMARKMKASEKLANEIGRSWIAVQDFIDGILNSSGLCPDAENDEIYCALRCIGWEPVDNVTKSK